MSTIACPKCKTWNPAQATRCRECGQELRGAQIAFTGPPPGMPKPRSAEEERAAEQRRAEGLAQARKAERERKRESEQRLREYQARKDQPRGEAPDRGEPDDSEGTSLESESRAVTGISTAEEAEATSHPKARESKLARLPTFVGGLDAALGGGIPAGYVIVVGGAPGTMKSSLVFWIVARNCADAGRHGLYVACEETTASLLRQMEAVGLDLASAAKGVKILDPPSLRKVFGRGSSGDWLAPLQAAVVNAREKDGLDFLVIDSLEALEILAKFKDRRQELFRLFEWLRDIALTTFVIAERPDYVVQGNVFQPRYEEDFLADGVLSLRLHAITDQEVQRRFRILKMRGTKHETSYLALHVGGEDLQVGRVLSA